MFVCDSILKGKPCGAIFLTNETEVFPILIACSYILGIRSYIVFELIKEIFELILLKDIRHCFGIYRLRQINDNTSTSNHLRPQKSLVSVSIVT